MEEKRMGGLLNWVKLLLLVPCSAVLWVPLYNSVEPRVFGIPFFYAWQIIWIGLGAALTWLVYVIGRKGRDV